MALKSTETNNYASKILSDRLMFIDLIHNWNAIPSLQCVSVDIGDTTEEISQHFILGSKFHYWRTTVLIDVKGLRNKI